MRRPSWTLSALCAVTAIGISASAAHAQTAAAEMRAVVELFTSQGCSSCPPADEMLARLTGDRSILAMSVPIDYWDYLGWKDTLARPRHSARQRGYAARRGDREVYTPQAVINGVTQVLGSDRKAIDDGIIVSHSRPGTLTVPVKVALNGDQFEVTVMPRDESGNEGEVWLCAIAKAIPVAIKRGENRGKTVTYHNVVRRWVKVGSWSGAGQTWKVAKSDIESEDIDSVAVLVQAGNADNPGPIFGAALLPLR